MVERIERTRIQLITDQDQLMSDVTSSGLYTSLLYSDTGVTRLDKIVKDIINSISC